eukprot:m.307659 g.307659  ORF g.307659 m.307659 type:complete len:71 (+) comp27390_c0_seq2:408-620(+)
MPRMWRHGASVELELGAVIQVYRCKLAAARSKDVTLAMAMSMVELRCGGTNPNSRQVSGYTSHEHLAKLI